MREYWEYGENMTLSTADGRPSLSWLTLYVEAVNYVRAQSKCTLGIDMVFRKLYCGLFGDEKYKLSSFQNYQKINFGVLFQFWNQKNKNWALRYSFEYE